MPKTALPPAPATPPGIGVYVHFPYCLSKCPYCDFAAVAVTRVDHRRYAQMLLRELDLRAPAFAARRARSVYVGGGTPSLWDPAALGEVLAAIAGAFPVEAGAEITLEANPGASDARRFGAYRALGVNRLSIGVQSFEPRTLAALGRRHTGTDAVRAYASARQAGFSNVTLDLIYGAPGQTAAQARDDASRAAALGPEHLSAYALTLEGLAEEVPLARAVRAGRVAVPGPDDAAEIGEAVRAVLVAAGYRRYEISNFARPGFESRHNLGYWQGDEYLGLGTGACGFLYRDPARPALGGVRYGNLRQPEVYLARTGAGALPEDWREDLAAATLAQERVFLGLRLVDGLDLEAACVELGVDSTGYDGPAAELERAGLARRIDRRLALTDRGLDLHTEAAVRLM